METAKVEVVIHVDNTPEAVIAYVADPRNRPLFLSILKTVSDIQGEPTAVGTTWKWTVGGFGMEFEGIGRCLEHQPGRLYKIQTEGGIEGTVTYRAEPEGEGARLTIEAECRVPQKAQAFLPAAEILEQMIRAEQERVAQSLKVILDK
jgi:carbon monoxide dehydrogenase subunit G